MFRLLGGSQKSGKNDVVLGYPYVTREIFLAEHYILVLISRPHHLVQLDSLDDYIVQPEVHFNGVITICYIFEI